MILKRVWFAILLGAVFVGTAAALKYAQAIGLIDAETVKRTVQVMSGLMLAAYSNFMPKDLGSWPASAAAVARAQSALRVGGWSLTLAGITYAGLWAFAPLAVADSASVIVVATALIITMGYAGRMLMACRSKHAQAAR